MRVMKSKHENDIMRWKVNTSDEFELQFSKLSRAEKVPSRVKPSWGISIFELLKEVTIFISISSKCFALVKYYNQISQFC